MEIQDKVLLIFVALIGLVTVIVVFIKFKHSGRTKENKSESFLTLVSLLLFVWTSLIFGLFFERIIETREFTIALASVFGLMMVYLIALIVYMKKNTVSGLRSFEEKDRKLAIMFGGVIIAAVLIVGGGTYLYRRYQWSKVDPCWVKEIAENEYQVGLSKLPNNGWVDTNIRLEENQKITIQAEDKRTPIIAGVREFAIQPEEKGAITEYKTWFVTRKPTELTQRTPDGGFVIGDEIPIMEPEHLFLRIGDGVEIDKVTVNVRREIVPVPMKKEQKKEPKRVV